MHRKMHQQLLGYVICVSLLLTIELYMENAYRHFAEAAPPIAAVQGTEKETPSIAQPYEISPVFMKKQATEILASQKEAVAEVVKEAVVPVTEIVNPEINAKAAKDPILTYVTSAHYLNVREEATSKSKILYVVEQGTELQVVQSTANGWLRLSDGGYVHGDYAAPVNAPAASASANEVKALSVASGAEATDASKPVPHPAKPTSKVMSDSGLTEAHIADILEGTDLEDQGLEDVILDIEDEYGINAYFTIAVMKLESGNGSSRLAKKKNNLFGLNAIDGRAFQSATKFKSKADSVRKFGQLISANYVDKGYTTIEKVARKYCPANTAWPALVKNIMKSDHNLV